MPAQKSGKLAVATKPVAKKPVKAVKAAKTPLKVVKTAKPQPKASAKPSKTPATKDKHVPTSKTPVKPTEKASAKDELKKPTKTAATEEVVKKKPGRPPKAASADGAAPATGAKRGRKPKNAAEGKPGEELDLSDIEEDLVGEPVAETTEKVDRKSVV